MFTTRPDTLCGATYVVIAPEHPLLDRLTDEQQREAVQAYVQAAASKSDLERTELQKSKTGVFTGGPCRMCLRAFLQRLCWLCCSSQKQHCIAAAAAYTTRHCSPALRKGTWQPQS